ncbi:MAG: sigma-E processing peptidase SpoIIGA [Lachnospiraceae bacterium]|nr:sigma-E processing peptidase SpoIIGA [Lachnospiraceae bacterium]
MYYEFYIDQFFIEQLIVGYLILASASVLCGNPVSLWRLIFGSLCSAACMTAVIWLKISWLSFLALPAGSGIAFWKLRLRENWRCNLRCTFSVLAVTICFGGALEVLVQVFPLPLMAAAVPASVFVDFLLRFMRRREQKNENTAVVTLYREGQSLVLTGFLDTGNQLTEPVSGLPVSIADEKALEPLLGQNWEERIGFCLIPYHSLGTDQGWLRGVLFDEMNISMSRGEKMFHRPLIALYEGTVSAQKEYRVILHPEHTP